MDAGTGWTSAGASAGGPWSLLTELHGDSAMIDVLSAHRLVQRWLQVEVELARAQAGIGIIPSSAAQAIADAAQGLDFDSDALWESSRTVGYPIFPLVRMLDAALPEEFRGLVHLGVTTQDIMDTGLVLQLRDALGVILGHVEAAGDGLALLVDRHATTVMAGRTHAHQAVPITLGMKLAVFLGEFARHRARIINLATDISVLSLHGAAGTSSAFGDSAAEVRSRVADSLGLRPVEIPWHVSRDRLTSLMTTLTAAATTCTRLAREVISLSRTEIGELGENTGHHRGASSTMPQKRNPIISEAIIGFGVYATALASAVFRAAEHEHERAAGEWQIEWAVVPNLLHSCSSAMRLACRLVDDLEVYPDRMLENLAGDRGSIMSEAHMMRLAPILGRERAHDAVYAAVELARQQEIDLPAAVEEVLGEIGGDEIEADVIAPDQYVGEAERVCKAAIESWTSNRTSQGAPK